MNWFANFWNQVKQFFGNFKITSDGNMTNRAQSGENSTPLPNTGVGQDINGVLGFEGNSDSNGLIGALKSWLYSMSGEHMPNADVERNAMQMQNQEDIFQRQVTGMQNAGINPALMYNSGISSAPGAPAPTQPGLNMSDIMQAVLLGKQSDLLDSRIRNTDAKTDKVSAETERIRLINEYYPELTRTQIDKMLSAIGVDQAQISKIFAEVDVLEVDKRLKEIDEVIKRAEADEASAFYKARREYEEAKDEESIARASEALARAFMETVEGQFMHDKGFRMGSSSVLAIASALASLFGIDETKGAGTAIASDWLESFKKPGGLLQEWIERLYKKFKGEE